MAIKQAFCLDAFPAPWNPKSADFFSFYLERLVFSWVLIDFLMFCFLIFRFLNKNLQIFTKKVPTFLGLSLSFQLLPWVLRFSLPWVFFYERPNKKPVLCNRRVANWQWKMLWLKYTYLPGNQVSRCWYDGGFDCWNLQFHHYYPCHPQPRSPSHWAGGHPWPVITRKSLENHFTF